MNIVPYILILFAAILWGTTGTLQTYLQEGISPISVAAFRSLFGGGILLIILVMMRKIHVKTWSWKWTVAAAILIGLFQISFFSSVRITGVLLERSLRLEVHQFLLVCSSSYYLSADRIVFGQSQHFLHSSVLFYYL